MPPPAPPRAPELPPEAAAWPDDLVLLLGPDADGLLEVVVGSAEGQLLGWRARHVAHQPGRSTVVQYETRVAWPGGATTAETLVAATGERIPTGATVLEADDLRVGVWRFPHDPALPGLARALDPEVVGHLLHEAGLGDGPARLRVRAYRPGRRAVVEATGDGGRAFLKVLRPHKVEDLHDRHRLLHGHLPVPASLGWSPDGLLVLSAITGATLREALRRDHSELPEPAALWAVLDALPAELAAAGPLTGDHLARVRHHAEVLAAPLPGERGRIEDLLAVLDEVAPIDGPPVPVHGDLYESQLLVDRDRIVGVLDIDTAGPGHRIDDVANLVAHLSVLGTTTGGSGGPTRYGTRLLADAERSHDRHALRTRVAAAVLALASGPFRVQEAAWQDHARRRIDLAEAWIREPRAP